MGKKIMLMVDIPASQMVKLLEIQATTGINPSRIIADGIENFNLQPMVKAGEAKRTLRLYLPTRDKRKLESLSHRMKLSIGSILRAIIADTPMNGSHDSALFR